MKSKMKGLMKVEKTKNKLTKKEDVIHNMEDNIHKKLHGLDKVSKKMMRKGCR